MGIQIDTWNKTPPDGVGVITFLKKGGLIQGIEIWAPKTLYILTHTDSAHIFYFCDNCINVNPSERQKLLPCLIPEQHRLYRAIKCPCPCITIPLLSCGITGWWKYSSQPRVFMRNARIENCFVSSALLPGLPDCEIDEEYIVKV